MCHRARDRVEVVPGAVAVVEALDHLAGDVVVADPLAAAGAHVGVAVAHRARDAVEQVPAGVLGVVGEVGLPVGHLAGHHVVVDPLAARGVDVPHALAHLAGHHVEVVPAAVAVVLALDHMTIGVETYPLARCASRNVRILVLGNRSIRVNPKPGVGGTVIDGLALGAHAIVIPIGDAANCLPAVQVRLVVALLDEAEALGLAAVCAP